MIWTSLFGILTVVLLARAMGFARAARLEDAGAAARLASAALPGLQPVAAIMSEDGCGAMVAGADGRVALLRPLGDRWVVRPANGAAVRVDDGRLHIDLKEAMFPPVTLMIGPTAKDWAGRL